MFFWFGVSSGDFVLCFKLPLPYLAAAHLGIFVTANELGFLLSP